MWRSDINILRDDHGHGIDRFLRPLPHPVVTLNEGSHSGGLPCVLTIDSRYRKVEAPCSRPEHEYLIGSKYHKAEPFRQPARRYSLLPRKMPSQHSSVFPPFANQKQILGRSIRALHMQRQLSQ
jgi:hypothetical protein